MTSHDPGSNVVGRSLVLGPPIDNTLDLILGWARIEDDVSLFPNQEKI
jgi:hypothetical protein